MKQLLFSTLLLFSNFVVAEDKYDFRPSTPPGQAIQVNEKDVRILNRALDLLSKESSWDRNDDRTCPTTKKKISLFCALYKATVEIHGEFDHRLGALEEVRRTVEEFSKGKNYEHRLMGYNNDASTTLRDIHIVLKTTEMRIAKRLKEEKR